MLPQKFYIYAYCYSAHPVGVWAAENQHRVSKLFLSSPCGIQRGEVPELEELRSVCDKDVLLSKEDAIKYRAIVNNNINFFSFLQKLPARMRKQMFKCFFMT